MAIWQYTFHVLHKESVSSLSNDYFFNHDDEGFDDELFWRKYPLKKNFFYEINSVLKRATSWSNYIDLYGNQESNCFEVLFDERDNVLSVSFRIDFRSNYKSIVRHIIEFCILNGLIILDEDLNIAPLNYEQVENIIETSSQVKKYNELSEKGKNTE